jgi:hypothetical protein
MTLQKEKRHLIRTVRKQQQASKSKTMEFVRRISAEVPDRIHGIVLGIQRVGLIFHDRLNFPLDTDGRCRSINSHQTRQSARLC